MRSPVGTSAGSRFVKYLSVRRSRPNFRVPAADRDSSPQNIHVTAAVSQRPVYGISTQRKYSLFQYAVLAASASKDPKTYPLPSWP